MKLIRLSEQKPTESDFGLFGEVLSVCLLKNGTELTFRDLSQEDISRIQESGQESHWFWISGIRDDIRPYMGDIKSAKDCN